MSTHATTPATADQPAPAANGHEPIWEVVIASVRARRNRLVDAEMNPIPAPSLDALIADMEARDALGRERYGCPLAPFNGRDSLVDLYQEILDACAYGRQHDIESGMLAARMMAIELEHMALRVREMIDAREATRP